MWDQLTGLGDSLAGIQIHINWTVYYPLSIPSNLCWGIANLFFDCTDQELTLLDLDDKIREAQRNPVEYKRYQELDEATLDKYHHYDPNFDEQTFMSSWNKTDKYWTPSKF